VEMRSGIGEAARNGSKSLLFLEEGEGLLREEDQALGAVCQAAGLSSIPVAPLI